MVMDNIGISIDTVTLDEGGFVTLLLIARHSNMEPINQNICNLHYQGMVISRIFFFNFNMKYFRYFHESFYRDVLWLIH